MGGGGSVYFFRQWHECFDFAQQWNKWLFLTFSAVVCLWLSLNDVLGWGLQREERERGAGLCNGYWREPGDASRAEATGAVFAMLNYQSFAVVSLTGGSVGRELLLPVLGETAPQPGRKREDRQAEGRGGSHLRGQGDWLLWGLAALAWVLASSKQWLSVCQAYNLLVSEICLMSQLRCYLGCQVLSPQLHCLTRSS